MTTNYLRLGSFDVPGYGLHVDGNLEIKTGDLSGETSGSGQVEKGIKPKTLTVSTSIRFSDSAALQSLIQVAEGRDSSAGGGMKVYTVVNRTANAAGVRQVQFTDNFRWAEQDGIRAWSVSFTLREYMSVAERAEQRLSTAKTVVSQTSDTKAITADGETTEPAPLSSFEKLLSTIDGILK